MKWLQIQDYRVLMTVIVGRLTTVDEFDFVVMPSAWPRDLSWRHIPLTMFASPGTKSSSLLSRFGSQTAASISHTLTNNTKSLLAIFYLPLLKCQEPHDDDLQLLSYLAILAVYLANFIGINVPLVVSRTGQAMSSGVSQSLLFWEVVRPLLTHLFALNG